MFKFTSIVGAAASSKAGKAIVEFASPILEKGPNIGVEITVRLAALALVRHYDDANVLTSLYTLVQTDIGAQEVADINPNVITKSLLAIDALLVPAGVDMHDFGFTVFDQIYAVIKEAQSPDAVPYVVEHIPPLKAIPIKTAGITSATPDVSDTAALIAGIAPLDLDTFLDDAHEVMRPPVTRILAHFYPQVFAQYRKMKDAPTATAKRDAYAFAWAAYRKFIAGV